MKAKGLNDISCINAAYTENRISHNRDGVTGKVLYEYPPYVGKARYHDTRVRRTVLQNALKARVPSTVIQLQKRLVDIVQQPGGGVTAMFEDGTSAYADLIIGADGIRSVSCSFSYQPPQQGTDEKSQGCSKSCFPCS